MSYYLRTEAYARWLSLRAAGFPKLFLRADVHPPVLHGYDTSGEPFPEGRLDLHRAPYR